MEIQFYRRRTAGSDEETNFPYTTAAFFIPSMTSDQLSLPAVVAGQLMQKSLNSVARTIVQYCV